MAKSNGNVQTVSLSDGREVCLSYGVIVAAFIPRGYDASNITGYVKTDKRYSVTTSKHANQYAGQDAQTIDDDTLRALVSPVTDKYRR